MKLALVVPGFSSDEQDWCIPAHTDIARALAARHEVHVFTMRYPHRVDKYQIGSVIVHSFNGVNSRGATSAHLWQRVASAIRREHGQGRFDVIQSIFGSESGSVAVLAAKLLRVPSVVWLVNGELVGLADINYGADLHPRQRWMNDLILKQADCVLCGCSALTNAALARNPKARAQTLPLGVETTRFYYDHSVDRSDNHAQFINVGSLLAVKDQHTLLSAFQRMLGQLPNSYLTIAGIGPLETTLRAHAAALGIADRVTFSGNIPHNTLAQSFRTAHVFVQSSRHEGQGMALLEAAACGCAVAGTNVGALADLAAASAAVSAPVGAVELLAEAMQNAFTDRQTLVARTGEILEREYTVTVTRTRLEKIYSRLACGNELAFEHNVARA